MKEFMQKYDKNSDGKIEMAEVSPPVLVKSYVGGGEYLSCLLHQAQVSF